MSFNLKSPAALAPNKKVSLFFEARHWFLSSYESPGWHLLPIKAVSFTLKICCVSVRSSRSSAAASMSALALFPCPLMLQRCLLSLNSPDQPLPPSDFSLAASSPLSAFTELKRVRAPLWIRLCLKEMCGSFDLLSRPLNALYISNKAL